jgi:hypothetical protein
MRGKRHKIQKRLQKSQSQQHRDLSKRILEEVANETTRQMAELVERYLSAISQNQPSIIEIKGLKTSHFKESKTCSRGTVDKSVQWGMSNVLKVSHAGSRPREKLSG